MVKFLRINSRFMYFKIQNMCTWAFIGQLGLKNKILPNHGFLQSLYSYKLGYSFFKDFHCKVGYTAIFFFQNTKKINEKWQSTSSTLSHWKIVYILLSTCLLLKIRLKLLKTIQKCIISHNKGILELRTEWPNVTAVQLCPVTIICQHFKIVFLHLNHFSLNSY